MSDPRNVWQSLSTKGAVMSAVEVRAKVQKMEAELRRDTTIAVGIAVAVTLAGGAALFQAHEPAARIFLSIAILLIWIGAWRTAARRRVRSSEAHSASGLEFYRHELQRRRDYFTKPPWILAFALVLALIEIFAVRA
jgi:hypothetical protein